jgi:hypothetical protein
MNPDLTFKDGLALFVIAMAPVVLCLGIWLIAQGKRPGWWDAPANRRRHQQATRKAHQKSHEGDGRGF